jgi:hypothetical protein
MHCAEAPTVMSPSGELCSKVTLPDTVSPVPAAPRIRAIAFAACAEAASNAARSRKRRSLIIILLARFRVACSGAHDQGKMTDGHGVGPTRAVTCQGMILSFLVDVRQDLTKDVDLESVTDCALG